MGQKDHLPTQEESLRKRNRDFKKVTSISYIGNPPVFTREVDAIGIVARTTGEVRDTEFPILADIEDLTNNLFTVVAGSLKTIQIELGKQEAQFHRLKLDDDAGAITDFVINMVGLAKNKALEFIADIETIFTGTPTITFNPPLAGLPSAFGDSGTNEFKLLISAIDTPIVTSFEVLNGADAGGGGGLTEPVIFGINTLTPQTLPTTTTISWNTKNPQRIILDRAVEFDFTNLPANGFYEGILVIIDIDAVGGFDSPIWPASLLNPPTIPTTPLSRFSVMLYTIDNGTIVTHATSRGSSSSGSGFSGNLSDLVINANKDWATKSITNMAAIQYVDVGSLARGSISGDVTSGLVLSTVSGGKFTIQDVVTPIATFDDTTGLTMEGTHVINMNKNIINTIRKTSFDGTQAVAPVDIQIDYNTAEEALVYHVPTIDDAHLWKINTELMATLTRIGSDRGQLSVTDIIAANPSAQATSVLQTNGQLLIADSSIDPTLNGQFRRNGVDVKVFTGGSLVNLSAVGSPDSIIDGNTSATVLDSAPSFTVVLDGSQKFSISNTRVDYEELDLFGVTSINMSDSGATPISTLTASLTGLLLNFIDTTDVYDIKFNGVDAFHIDETKTLITSTVPNTGSALLHIFRDDPSPTDDDVVGEVQFRGRDSAAANIVYGKVGVEIEDATGATSTGSFQWTVRNQGLDQDMMSLTDGVLGVSRNSLLLTASQGAAMVLVRNDTGAGIGDEAGELDFNINDGTERVYGNISVTWDNTSVGDDSSRMDFKLLTDDILRTIFTIRGSAVTDNKISIEVGADSFIKASTGVMGYFVTNDPTITSSIGDSGTMQIPQFNNGSPSLSDLNTAFGAFDGAIGQDISDGKLYVRKSSTAWSFYNESGTVT